MQIHKIDLGIIIMLISLIGTVLISSITPYGLAGLIITALGFFVFRKGLKESTPWRD